MGNSLFRGLKVIVTGFKIMAALNIIMGVSIFAMGIPLGEITLKNAIMLATVVFGSAVWFIIVCRWVSQLKKKGFRAVVITLAALIIYCGFSALRSFKNGMGVSLFFGFLAIIFGVSLFYLTRPKVKEQFK